VRAGNIPGLMPGSEETYMSYDLPWANVSNTPFRYYKHWVHEGGISTPLIVSWPNVIRDGGRITDRPAHLIDIMATVLEASGVPYPVVNRGRVITPPEGESLMPTFRGSDAPRVRPLFWEHRGNCAVRMGEWKLVKKYGSDWELYNMAEDRTELHDLAGQLPNHVRELEQLYTAWANRCGVMDWEALLRLRKRRDGN
jgi:arylsulfatase